MATAKVAMMNEEAEVDRLQEQLDRIKGDPPQDDHED